MSVTIRSPKRIAHIAGSNISFVSRHFGTMSYGLGPYGVNASRKPVRTITTDGGRGKPESRGRGLTDPNKSLMAIAVETVPASLRQGEGIKKSRFIAGSARIAVLPSATAADLGGFVRGAAKPGARIITDGLKSYDALADSFRHYSIVQDGGEYADAVLPIVHVLFSNVKTWLNGTFHGVSVKHLPRYAREWNYRFNRCRT